MWLWGVIGIGYLILGIVGLLKDSGNIYWQVTTIIGVIWLVIVIYNLKMGKVIGERGSIIEDILVLGSVTTIFLASVIISVINNMTVFLLILVTGMLLTYLIYKKEKLKSMTLRSQI